MSVRVCECARSRIIVQCIHLEIDVYRVNEFHRKINQVQCYETAMLGT